MSVLIGGGSGFVGRAVTSVLKDRGIKFRIISRKQRPGGITWNDLRNGLPEDTQHVVNLAGATLADFTKSWDRGYKREVFDSRIKTTRALAEATRQSSKVTTFVQTSAVGYYPPSETIAYDEVSPGGDDTDVFTKLCRDWEAAGDVVASPNVRRVILRLGVVLGRQGGLVRSVYWPFLFGLGGPVGSGRQWLPWIHVDDLARLYVHVLTSPQKPEGILNAVAPQPASSGDFSRALAKALRRPALFGTPEFVVKCLFDKDRANLVLTGQKVVPMRTLESGFQYKFPSIESACQDLVKTSK